MFIINYKCNNAHEDLKYRLNKYLIIVLIYLTINLKINGEIKSVLTPGPVTMKSEEKIIALFIITSSKDLYRFYNRKKILVIGGSTTHLPTL